MPFLRRRGIMASESDMRRHSPFDAAAMSKNPPPQAGSSTDLTLSISEPSHAGPSVPAPPATPPDDSPASSTRDAVSTDDPIERPVSPPVQEESSRHRRFSMLRFRNASDSQLAAKAKAYAAAEKPPPLPQPPEIITTAPTIDFNNIPPKKAKMSFSLRVRKSRELPRFAEDDEPAEQPAEKPAMKKDRRRTLMPTASYSSKHSVKFEDPVRPGSSTSPPSYGDDNGSSLALPVNRLSESSRSDASSGERVYGSTTTTTHTVHTTTTFFRLPRRKPKQPEPLFPIAHLAQKGSSAIAADSSASNLSLVPSAGASAKPGSTPSKGAAGVQTPTASRPSSGSGLITPPAPSPALALLGKSGGSPATALFRPHSRNSGHSSPTRTLSQLRGRSSTLSSLGRNTPRHSIDEHASAAAPRASTSTGRKSFGDLLGLSRLRQNSEVSGGRQGNLTPATPGSNTSKNNSLQLVRESVVLPERRDDDTPAKYLARLEEVVSRSVIAAAVSKGTDSFSQAVLRSYMRTFGYFGDPMDMAIRKLLMEAELPKETQQIDRFLQAFANRYHECNPGIYLSPDQAYFIAFSLLILHTDVFNKNNKHKMQKADYLKNTNGEGIFDEILEVFYDNITYTPFIHVEDDLDINGDRIIAHKAKNKGLFPRNAPDPAKKVAKEPIDPYMLIIDGKLDILRPNLKDVMHLDDHYSYLGTAKTLNLKELQKTFFKTGVLQIVSARSRPDAFLTEKTLVNPEEAHPGIVDIKVTKVGLIWRKDPKKRKARSPWQEWGAILTGAQLYFFRNVAWIKSLMHQFETHIRQGHDGIPVIFKPPLDQFKPDALMSTDGAVALLDTTYKRHKHAFVYVRHGGIEEVLLADDEDEMNDWLAKLNYASAFRTSGVRMRGVTGGAIDGQGRRALRRLDTDATAASPTGEVTVTKTMIDHKMAQDILHARRDIMFQKVKDFNEKLEHAEKILESQLRNSRHLQILAPIHPKTREQMLLSAARMAAQLKWTRTEIWRLKCHRDILVMDLEEERQLLGLHPAAAEPMTPDKATSVREEQTPQKSPKSPVHLNLTRSSTINRGAGGSDVDSPMTDVFQTPPTSATAASFHRHQNSWELPGLTFDHVDMRKLSVSSAASNRSITATPPRKVGSSSSAAEPPSSSEQPEEDEHDVLERGLLERAGLVETEATRNTEGQTPVVGGSIKKRKSQKRKSQGKAIEQLDRNKQVRRSLQRTLREGAGHLSHHRSRKGKDSSSAVAVMSDDLLRGDAAQPDVLTRGSGSFIVHGKKASVITFGSDLQAMSPEERLRQRKVLQVPDEATSPTDGNVAPEGGNSSRVNGEGAHSDFRAILTAAESETEQDRKRRDSAASASTATARSFRELHRKYSAAQAAKGPLNGSAGTLTVPSDEDSDAAVSFSDGRRSPRLPPIEGEGEEEEEDDDDDDDGDSDEEESEEDDDDDDDGSSGPPSPTDRQAQFFTPEPPSSPNVEPVGDAESSGGHATPKGGGERLPSPPIQVVSA